MMSLITVSVGATVVQMMPEAPQPSLSASPVVTMKQARLALAQANRIEQIEAAISSLPDEQQRRARIEWEYSTTIERNNPVLIQLAEAIGMPDAEIDALFAVAAQL